MKQNFVWSFGLVVLLASCRTPNGNVPSTATTLDTAPAMTMTETTIPLTQPNKSTPIPTVSPSPSPTSSPLPTMTAEQRVESLVASLADQTTCGLPCLLTLIPGSTSVEDARSYFAQLGATWTDLDITSSSDIRTIEVGHLFENEPSSYIVFVLTHDASVVKTWRIKSDAYDYFSHDDESRFWDVWDEYSLTSVLSKYGAPEQVLIDSAYNIPTDPQKPAAGYDVWLLYESFAARYSGAVSWSQSYEFCFGRESHQLRASIELFGQDPDAAMKTSDAIPPYSTQERYFVTTEEAFGLSSEEFGRLITNTGEVCLTAPGSLWP